MDLLNSLSARAVQIEKSRKLAKIYTSTAIDYANYSRPQGVDPKFDIRFQQLVAEAERHAKTADELQKNIILKYPPLSIPIKVNGKYNIQHLFSASIRMAIVFLAFVFSKVFKHI